MVTSWRPRAEEVPSSFRGTAQDLRTGISALFEGRVWILDVKRIHWHIFLTKPLGIKVSRDVLQNHWWNCDSASIVRTVPYVNIQTSKLQGMSLFRDGIVPDKVKGVIFIHYGWHL